MQVSVETLNGLERKVTVSVPADKVEGEVSLRLRDLTRKVKVDGFRPGKVPLNVVKSRYENDVRQEVATKLVESTLFNALQEQELTPADYPQIELESLEQGKDFTYSATFEIMPKPDPINELAQANVDLTRSEVHDNDVSAMLEKLREQNKEWHEVSRAAELQDKVVIDFEGFLNNEPFDGGSAQGHELVLGSNSMIPGFEDAIVGHETAQPFDITLTFPKDYGHKDLADKEVTFKITIQKIMAGTSPELNDAFAAKFNIKEGGVDALKKDIKDNMVRELERRVSALNREKLFDALMNINPMELPNALVDKEIAHLKHEMYHRLFGNEHKDDEKIPDFPRELFEEQAKRRVHLGLLFSEYVKKHQITVDSEKVNATIDKFASAYESPEELRQWYQGNKEHMAEIEALVMEDMVAEQIGQDAVLNYIDMDYDAVMNPKKGTENKGD